MNTSCWRVSVLVGAIVLGPRSGCTPALSLPAAGSGPASGYGAVLTGSMSTLSFLANVAGGLVFGVATVRGLLLYAFCLMRPGGVPNEALRLSLERSLALALKLPLEADILVTA